MKIDLNQSEIETALVAYIADQGIDLTGKNIEVSLVAGRGVNGHSASIEISNAVAAVTELVTAPEIVIPSSEAEQENSKEEPSDNQTIFG